MTDLHITQPPRGVLASQRLLRAVAERGDLAERHFLELKSTLNLSTKKDKEKIAKFILGAANRMPATAATAFEGYAVMLVGVAEGAITGIPPVEMMDIAKVVQQYVGAAGPKWDIIWVPIEGSANQVLVVLVDPPMPGQGPFPCRANGESLTNGRIYMRAEGETREATADELDLLIQRGAAAPKVEIDFAVELLGAVSPINLDAHQTLEAYLDTQKTRLLSALPISKPSPGSDDVDALAAGHTALTGFRMPSSIVQAMMIPEERSEEGYRKSIVAWEDRFRVAWEAAREKIAASVLAPIVVKITNRSTVFFQDVEMRLHLEGEVFAHDAVEAEAISDLGLPRPPRLWGPREPLLNVAAYAGLGYAQPPISMPYSAPSVSFKNSGSVDLDFGIGELRPLGYYESEDEEFVLIVRDPALSSIHGTWRLTARDHHEVFEGEITIPVTNVVDITDVARRVLRYPRDE
jgi:hypothetical protein